MVVNAAGQTLCPCDTHDSDGYEPCEDVECCNECGEEFNKDDIAYMPDAGDFTKLCPTCKITDPPLSESATQ